MSKSKVNDAKLRLVQTSLKDLSTIEEYQRLAWKNLKTIINGCLHKGNTSNLPLVISELFQYNIVRGRGFPGRTFRSPDTVETGRKDEEESPCSFLSIFVIEMVARLLKNPTDDSVVLAIELMKECEQKLSQVYPHKPTLCMIQILFVVRAGYFNAYPPIPSGLDLVDEDDQFTHIIELDNACEPIPMLDVFQYDKQFEENEEKYKKIRRTILDETSDNDDESSTCSLDTDEEDDRMETIDLNNDAEKCACKLLKMNASLGQEMEVCQIIIDSCAQRRRHEPFLGLLGQRLRLLKSEYVEYFEKAFHDQCDVAHHFENVKLKNVGKLFAHLFLTNSISWTVLRCIRLTDKDTTSSSRTFIKVLFLELFQFLGLTKLISRLMDPAVLRHLEGLFPRDDAQFCINFLHQLNINVDKGLNLFILLHYLSSINNNSYYYHYVNNGNPDDTNMFGHATTLHVYRSLTCGNRLLCSTECDTLLSNLGVYGNQYSNTRYAENVNMLIQVFDGTKHQNRSTLSTSYVIPEGRRASIIGASVSDPYARVSQQHYEGTGKSGAYNRFTHYACPVMKAIKTNAGSTGFISNMVPSLQHVYLVSILLGQVEYVARQNVYDKTKKKQMSIRLFITIISLSLFLKGILNAGVEDKWERLPSTANRVYYHSPSQIEVELEELEDDATLEQRKSAFYYMFNRAMLCLFGDSFNSLMTSLESYKSHKLNDSVLLEDDADIIYVLDITNGSFPEQMPDRIESGDTIEFKTNKTDQYYIFQVHKDENDYYRINNGFELYNINNHTPKNYRRISLSLGLPQSKIELYFCIIPSSQRQFIRVTSNFRCDNKESQKLILHKDDTIELE
ncbi:unnamed protein product [Rotaria magnacalcarata]|uniref:MI domain-containing protein n=3 Tax=Rotaria magnacalcarata TaxID=392030 RepID=A0A8S2N0S2_9BILA|nr:unnamed protein product [Rotaria magnacalcarata]